MDDAGQLEDGGRFPHRRPDRDDDVRRDLRVADGAHLHHRLHGGGRRLPALLLLHLAVHLQHVDAGDEQQHAAAVLRLGSGGPGVLSADRLLVQKADRDLRQHEGLPGEPGRRLRLHPGHRPVAGLWRHAELRRDLCQGGDPVQDGLPGHGLGLAERCLHLPVHRCDGQVGPVPAACLAAGFDGRPNADFRADPRRDDGDGRHLHGGAHVAAVRAERHRAELRHGDRRDHGAVHGLPRHHPERHQARGGVFDAVPARLHDRGPRRVGLLGGRLPPDDPCLLQGAAVPGRGLGHHRHAP
mmetsp:Transcript_15026/g.35423  ORF Transcript_15026/g.35423 Transcript_15026/m.35423 type:complete len:298 (+) Transcript_15026:749-1642(+)